VEGAIERAIEEVFSNPFPPSPAGIYQQSRAITNCDTSTRLGGIRCPTLIVAGSEDILSRISFSEQLAQGIPGAEFVSLERCGHSPLTEKPEGTAVTMLDFLSRSAFSAA
jgi:3-oxoadipate enol-lactonase